MCMEKGKCISMSVRVSTEELSLIKRASEYEKYSSYSEFVRRTILIEASNIVDRHKTVKERSEK